MLQCDAVRAEAPGYPDSGAFPNAVTRLMDDEPRQQFMADAIAGMAQITVALIFTPRLTQAVQILLNLCARNIQQWTDQFFLFLPGSNACQSACACTANNSHENGFGLIVCIVREHDVISTAGAERGVTGLARRPLDAIAPALFSTSPRGDRAHSSGLVS